MRLEGGVRRGCQGSLKVPAEDGDDMPPGALCREHQPHGVASLGSAREVGELVEARPDLGLGLGAPGSGQLQQSPGHVVGETTQVGLGQV